MIRLLIILFGLIMIISEHKHSNPFPEFWDTAVQYTLQSAEDVHDMLCSSSPHFLLLIADCSGARVTKGGELYRLYVHPTIRWLAVIALWRSSTSYSRPTLK